MTKLTDADRDAFLAETRIGILSTAGEDGWPISVPVWFEWDGSHARVFTSATSPKVGRLERDPRVSLLVVNNVGEQEYWVAIKGQFEIREDGAAELAKRLAERYWDMTDEDHKKTVEMWVAESASLRLLEIVPTQIRSYGG